ncbi:hypothetical protein [Kurthia sibirica]|uniref:Uncharacterized protein n=1 Tax=Kurthia sibirica TaxID=202750 RepID=A0A2U3AK51_9BACL|nr:hypothetical protein [Kurthia sibirica]PWI24912.1 hypothetical protein DEX24_10895 [Kurthia sibirica]GEK33178.1 hypothetical protein KSI01_07110 [Kurthia sibirica]
MGNKKKSLLLAGLAAGAYAYLRKPENRDKALEAFNSTKTKVNDFIETQKSSLQEKRNGNSTVVPPTEFDDSITGDEEKDYQLEEKEMVSEGALTTVQYYNEETQERLDAKK